MFRPLPVPAIDLLALHVAHARFAAGQEIFHRGDHGDRFYVIADGQADVIGDGRLIRTIGPGDCFGEIAPLRDTPAHHDRARTRSPVRVHSLDRRHFVSALSGYPSSVREADALVHERLQTFQPPPAPSRS